MRARRRRLSEHDRLYCTPEQVALRNRPGEAVCVDEECGLSGGYAHAGPCEPCRCGAEHAVEECPRAERRPP